jgi:DNA topoisomerase-3
MNRQIHNAAQHPVELDTRQADAVEARIMLDLKVGSAFTRLQTLILQGRVPQIANEKSVVSYGKSFAASTIFFPSIAPGPCQFPTLGFVVQRYSLVKNFTPEPFWYIYLSLTRPTHSQGREEETKFNWKRNHIFDEVVVMNLFARMGNSLAVVTKVANKTTKKW